MKCHSNLLRKNMQLENFKKKKKGKIQDKLQEGTFDCIFVK